MISRTLGFEVTLTQPVDEAIERVTDALQDEGFGVLTRIDVHTTFEKKLGEKFRPYVILGACNPGLAHRVLSHRPETGLMLPCNLSVESRPEGGSLVRIGDPDQLLSLGDLGADPMVQEVAREARTRLQRVAERLEGAAGDAPR